ncbi:TonB-dependent receptor [Parvicella tangerina]|uniref:TonB-dependent receptor n=1 Tax=Parvicella tangerina TaxID=2829795 RepID=A0A916JRY8_9FLAO|nr:TonB-dependent receptor [Parvicella tangerina]CAG5086486.1 hypothetical protein CRYO30217_03139 [Parvicella tangerina]
MKNILTILTTLFIIGTSFSQQTVKGKVVDSESKFPLPGVNVLVISDTTKTYGAATDVNGNFKITDVPLGRQQLKFSFIGYNPNIITIEVNSGKETVANVELEESSMEMEEFKVVASDNKEVANEMAVVSAQQFSVEETNRYAGSRGDPARMASNFAGVQGADDSRNDIVVRGNSPLGVIYRVEGITIPNPNHFSIAGSSGGPVSIINNKSMANSDFFTGAFPAEYGNSTAGVFDLKLRAGNNEKFEFSGQFGFLGTELLAEGPLSKQHRSSFLVMYRYSTLTLFSSLGINIGTSAVPGYQDFAAKFNFPLNNGGNLAIWGLGGKSNIDILISNQKDTSEVDLYGENTKDQYFGTQMYVGGVTYTHPLNKSTYLKSTLTTSLDQQNSFHDTISRNITSEGTFELLGKAQYMAYEFKTLRFSSATSINKKFGKKDVLKFGYVADYADYNFLDSVTTNSALQTYRYRWNSSGSYYSLQPYVSWKHKFSDNLVLTAGLSSFYYSIGDAFSPIEPRLGLKWDATKKGSFSFGLGRHSQAQPTYTYFYLNPGNSQPHNTELGLTYSNHIVAGYTHKFNKNLGGKIETYYQSLSGIPVETDSSSFALTNAGGGFSRLFPDTLQNTGTGYNYGVEVTLQRYFSGNWHAMFTGSLYNSRYVGSDGIERNTSYNGIYAVNFLAGKEFVIKERKTIGIGVKVTSAGGKRYGEVDTTASNLQGEVVFTDNNFNEYQFDNYFRFDLKLTFKANTEKVTHEIGLDLVNLLNTKNILSLSYAPVPGDPSANPIRENYQLGFLPIFYYRIDF